MFRHWVERRTVGQPYSVSVSHHGRKGAPVNLGAVVGLLRPNTASLGYGLFLAINAASVWGGVFPFLPLSFQTPEVMLWFFGAESLAFALTFLASAAGTYLFPAETRHFMVKAVAVPYMGGWCLLIGAMYARSIAVALAGAGGALLGVGSAGFYMLWQRLFASQDAREGMGNLIAGTAWAAVLYFALYLIPVAVTAYLIPCVFLPLFGLAVVLKSRTIDLDQPMFQDVPREHPRTYRHVLSTIWRTALTLGTLGFCTGVMRSLAVGDPAVGTIVNALSMAASCAAAVALLAVWAKKNLRINVATSYRLFFPVVTTAFLLLPLLGRGYAGALAAGLYALWSVTIMLMMIQCAQVSRDGGINPVFIYGAFGGIMYGLHDVGFIGGRLIESLPLGELPFGGLSPLALITIGALYLLGIMYFVGQGGFRRALSTGAPDEIELLALRRKTGDGHRPGPSSQPSGAAKGGRVAKEGRPEAKGPEAQHEGAGASEGPARTEDAGSVASPHAGENRDGAALPRKQDAGRTAGPFPGAQNTLAGRGAPPSRDGHEAEATYRDRFSKQMAAVRESFGLSAREAEVAELIARGNTVAHIAELLFVSENTVRTHSKRIYVKLGIHKRQELIELVESFDPEGR